MKYARVVEARVFVKEGEDEENIKSGLLSLFPYGLGEQKIRLDRKSATGFNEKKIIILSVKLEKDRHMNAFIRGLMERLSASQKSLLVQQLSSRVDDGSNFFVRFDKKTMLGKGALKIIDSGDCYHIRIGIASYPSRKDIAVKIMKGLLAAGE